MNMRNAFSIAVALTALLTSFSQGFGVGNASAKAVKTVAPKVTLAAFVRGLLPEAPTNFDTMRGVKDDFDTYYVRYKVLPKFSSSCGACKVYDEYARGTYIENWYVQDRWTVGSTWNATKTESYIKTQLTPVLSGFSLHRTVDYKYPTLVWRNPRNEWVYVDTFNGGFTVRVGRDLPKNVHVLLPPSQAQLAELRNAAENAIKLGVPPATDNFDVLRTTDKQKNIFGDYDYGVNMSFGPMFRKCDISNITTGLGFSDFQPKWVLSCDTVSMAGTRAGLEENVRSAVYDALPYGFNAVTDKDALLLDDYRWDNESSVSVNISSYEDTGIVNFTISIYHFLPKPTSTSTP
jgi:hypothetical protein